MIELLTRVSLRSAPSKCFWAILSRSSPIPSPASAGYGASLLNADQDAAKLRKLPDTMSLKRMFGMAWDDIKLSAEKVEIGANDVNFEKLYDDIVPDKVLGIGLNYKDHCDEQNIPMDKRPKEPLIFNKFASTIIPNNGPIKYPEQTNQLDYEVELACIIGKECRDVGEAEALDHVFGYTVANDVTARDWQKFKNGKQWILGKSMDTFCPLGPGIRHGATVEDPHQFSIWCTVNGELRQSSSTSNLIFNVPKLICFISHLITLYPGDVILTGTPGGVGAFFDPPKFLVRGDRVVCSIDGIGQLTNEIQ